jgi:hypothetical protein
MVSQGGLGQGRTDTKGGRVCEREDQSAPKKIRVLIHSWINLLQGILSSLLVDWMWGTGVGVGGEACGVGLEMIFEEVV